MLKIFYIFFIQRRTQPINLGQNLLFLHLSLHARCRSKPSWFAIPMPNCYDEYIVNNNNTHINICRWTDCWSLKVSSPWAPTQSSTRSTVSCPPHGSGTSSTGQGRGWGRWSLPPTLPKPPSPSRTWFLWWTVVKLRSRTSTWSPTWQRCSRSGPAWLTWSRGSDGQERIFWHYSARNNSYNNLFYLHSKGQIIYSCISTLNRVKVWLNRVLVW